MNEKEIKDLLNTIEDQIPDDYCRSYDSADGLCHTWPDEDSWQYKTLKYIKQLQQENQQLKEQLQQRDEVFKEIVEFVNKHKYQPSPLGWELELIPSQLYEFESILKTNVKESE